ncbi:hypothetical protein OMD49_30330 [Bacillus anthracis]|nr:hypothetical protein [Bacillus anthracis]
MDENGYIYFEFSIAACSETEVKKAPKNGALKQEERKRKIRFIKLARQLDCN